MIIYNTTNSELKKKKRIFVIQGTVQGIDLRESQNLFAMFNLIQ